ncbi:acyltransferase family protein [Actinacidiphila sp. bgisy160]|uniref:acyltransferase family protein n=1 Tax=Actinacidiphila sp. bgisy160 TaxID=3413796 RepID=UPI003D709565
MFQPLRTNTLSPGRTQTGNSVLPAPRKKAFFGPGTAAPAGSSAPATSCAPSAGRDPFFDNAKYLAIVLVAMGHAWEPLTGHSRAAGALYNLVYAFHMPAFIVISGYFSKSFDARPDRVRRLITGVAVPYLLFEAAYSLFRNWADDAAPQPLSLLDPWYLTWFLAALFIWRLTAPVWRIVRHPVVIALVIAALASLSPAIGDDLELQRVLQFLPFFVLGMCLKAEHFHLARRRAVRVLSVPVGLAALVVSYWLVPRMDRAWLYHRTSAQELGAPWWTGPVVTPVLFCCSLALTVCFFAWVPRRRMWFTALGAGTLYGYLLHGFIAKGSRFGSWYDHDWIHTPLGQVAITAIAVAVVTALCTPPVQRLFRFAMEPKMSWAFRPAPGAVGKVPPATFGRGCPHPATPGTAPRCVVESSE